MKRLIVCSCFMLLFLSIMAQTQNNLMLNGFVIDDDQNRIENAKVYVYDSHERLLKELNTTNEGRFEFTIDFDDEYDIVFTSSGHTGKILQVDTRGIPMDQQEWGFEYGGFSITLNPSAENLAPKKVALIYYDDAIENFGFQRFENK